MVLALYSRLPRLIIHGFTLSLSSRTFRPALSAVLITLAALVCCTLSHAQLIDSTYILAVDRRVQEIDAAKDHGIRTLENKEFLVQMTDGGGELKGFVETTPLGSRLISLPYSNTLKYSSNRYTRPHLLPVISRKMPTCSNAAMSL